MSILLRTSRGVLPIAGCSACPRNPCHRRPWILRILLVELVLAGLAVAALGDEDTVLAALLGVMLAVLLVRGAASMPEADGPGPADLVTGLRLGMAIGIGTLALFAQLPAALLAGLLVLALATDALDG